jgi:hypothetical protein
MYRWELDNDSNHGPFKTFMPSPDKGWIATNSIGDVYIAHYHGIEKSIDHAQTFQRVDGHIYSAPHPRINDNDCLIITEFNLATNCHSISTKASSQEQITEVVSNDVPGTFRVFQFWQNAIHPNGDVYIVYMDYKSLGSNDLTIYMAKSTDEGSTFSEPWIIAADIVGDQFYPWIEIDSLGGIHVIYFDTRNGNKPDNSIDATLDIYYQYSQDFGQTWQETRVTPNSFTTPELIWSEYFLTDYLSMDVASDHVYLAFPWSTQTNEMHMYFAKKLIPANDLIFSSGFD